MSNPLFKYKITIAYDGTNYHGWQLQPHSLSIQEILQTTFQVFLQKEISLIGSGRTDAGVHALGQTAHFSFDREIDIHRFLIAANALLPKDIRILHVERVPLDFHAQYSTLGKIYHYHLQLNRRQNPLKRLYSLHVPEQVDLNILAKASQLFVGTHDFASFANAAHEGSASRGSVRTVHRVEMILESNGEARLEFEGNGFLYKMVRNMVGMLLEISSYKRSIEEIPKLLEARDRRLAAKAAPPHGLFLAKVIYARHKVQADF